MGELLAATCGSCGEPMVPKREHAGRGRLRLDLPEPRLPGPGCRGAGGRGSGGGRRAGGARRPSRQLIEHYADAEEARAREADAPTRARERAQAELARLHALVLEVGRLAEGAGALAAHLSDSLAVSYRNKDYAEAEDARQALAAAGALCAVVRRTAADAQEWARRRRPPGCRGYALGGASSLSSCGPPCSLWLTFAAWCC